MLHALCIIYLYNRIKKALWSVYKEFHHLEDSARYLFHQVNIYIVI
jgi:hypothetical protein